MQRKDKKSIREERSVGDSSLWFILALVVVGTLVYSNTFFSSFHFDDRPSVTDNLAIKHIHSLGAIWSFWPTRFITYLSFAVNHYFHGLNVFDYHLFNLAVHLGSGLLVFWFSLLTFSTSVMKDQKISSHAKLISFFTGLVFITHPVQTEAVTYIVQRAASLGTFFYLASLCFYVNSRLTAFSVLRKSYYVISIVAAVLAMFSKEMTITLPLMICLYEFSFFKTYERIDWRRLIPILACLFVVPLVMFLTNSINFGEMRRATEPAVGLSSSQYLLTQLRVIVTYIRLVFLPINQNLDYDYPVATTLLNLSSLLSLSLLVGIVTAAARLFRNYRLVSLGIYWFFLTLLPESSIIPIKDIIFEHRLYLPMVGFSIFFTGGIYYFFGENHHRAIMATLLIMIGCYSVLAYQRNNIWKDDLTLWNDTVNKSLRKSRPYDNRGVAYFDKGNFNQAITDFSRAIEINPRYFAAYSGRGNAYAEQGNFDQALADFNKAIAINPDYADAYNGRGTVYFDKRNLNQALADFSRAIEINPRYADVYANRGNTYAEQGNFDQALADFNKAIAINPDYADAYNGRGSVFADKGNFEQALLSYNKTIEIKSDFAEAYADRAKIYYKMHNYAKSWKDVHRAQALGCNVNPSFIEQLKKDSRREEKIF